MENRPSKTHPEVIATQHMTEDEEMNYLYDKYIKEPPKPEETNDDQTILNIYYHFFIFLIFSR